MLLLRGKQNSCLEILQTKKISFLNACEHFGFSRVAKHIFRKIFM